MKQNIAASALAFVLSAFFSLPATAQKVMKPGGWEMTSSVSMQAPGQPAQSMGEQKMKMCLTADYLAKDPYLTAGVDQQKAGAKGAKCSTSDAKRQGNDASWTMRCTMANGGTSEARITNHAEAETLTTRVEQTVQQGSGPKQQVVMKMNGRYAGACDPSMIKP